MTATVTRRQLLRAAGAGALGLGFGAAASEIVAGALASRGPGAPKTPNWRSRADLRIPSLTVARNDAGASSDPIFIAPYNVPVGQVGAVIVASDGQPIWENPL